MYFSSSSSQYGTVIVADTPKEPKMTFISAQNRTMPPISHRTSGAFTTATATLQLYSVVTTSHLGRQLTRQLTIADKTQKKPKKKHNKHIEDFTESHLCVRILLCLPRGKLTLAVECIFLFWQLSGKEAREASVSMATWV